MILESFSENDTGDLAALLAENAEAGEVYALSGDLGAGKTVFTKGFARGLKIKDTVTSPTFNIVKTYNGGRLTLHHFDAYRITDPMEMEAIGFEEYLYSGGVIVIEWPEQIPGLIPDNACYIHIGRDIERGDNYRLIEISGGKR